jgi:hypothetical protein
VIPVANAFFILLIVVAICEPACHFCSSSALQSILGSSRARPFLSACPFVGQPCW